MDKQIRAWSKLYGRQITEEEYRKICNNLKGFFDTLHEWDKAEKEKMKLKVFDILNFYDILPYG